MSAPSSYTYTAVFPQDVSFATTAADIGKALPVGRDLFLDPVTGDLALTAGDLTLVADISAIRQEAEIRMRFFLAEWFLDQTVGIPYFQNILVKAPNLDAIESVFRSEVLATVGIKSITKFDLDFNRSQRKLNINWQADTDLNELITSTVEFET